MVTEMHHTHCFPGPTSVRSLRDRDPWNFPGGTVAKSVPPLQGAGSMPGLGAKIHMLHGVVKKKK